MAVLLDGTGKGYKQKVDQYNRAHTLAVVNSDQHDVSHEHGLAFQVEQQINIAAATQVVLYLQNDDTDRDMVITYIRVMSAGAATTNTAAYFDIEVDDTYTSGGTALTPVNVNTGSSNTAQATAYYNNPTLGGTGSRIDRNFEANTMQTYNKEGALIIGTGSSISVKHTGSTAAGVAWARISFYFTSKFD